MRDRDVREAVEAFFAKHAPGGRMAEDAFPAWWLHREFDLSPSDAASCSSTGSYDHGLDAFFLDVPKELPPTLHLIQAKFTSSRQQIRDGIRGFKQTLSRLESAFGRDFMSDQENTVWVRLRSRIEGRDLSGMVLHCRVIHLSESDEDVLLSEFRGEKADFEEAAAAIFPDNHVRLTLSGPSAFEAPKVSIVPGVQKSLRFAGIETSSGAQKLFIGLGNLADLVKLYEENGDILFSKNVRLFNYRALDKGPARHLRDTLRMTCVGNRTELLDPLHFALFHNGITLHAKSAERDGDVLKVRSPGVLNGCQTVKSAWMFRNDRILRQKINQEAWESILVPLRVVRTTDDELVRRVTVSNNRQTAIRPSAFRSNDPLQLRLGERLREAHIFYERQEDSFVNLKKMSPKTLETEFGNSFDAPLKMEELAQALAAVLPRETLSAATKPTELFESPLYDRLFAETNLTHIQLLVFATNVLRCVHLALKDTRDKASSKLEQMAPSRFRFLATRVLVRWVVKNCPEVVTDFGTAVLSKPGTKSPFRDRLRRLLSPQNSQFQTLIPDIWGKSDPWLSATDKDATEKLLRKLRIHELDAFAEYDP